MIYIFDKYLFEYSSRLSTSLVETRDYCLFGTKLLPEPMMNNYKLDICEYTVKSLI